MAIGSLAQGSWARLRQQAVDSCAHWKQAILRSEELLTRHRLLRHAQLVAIARSTIGRKLRSGRLPREWPLILSGAPADGGLCDGCDRPLLPQEMAMTLRGRDVFVHFHADCFLIWDDVRTHTSRDER